MWWNQASLQLEHPTKLAPYGVDETLTEGDKGKAWEMS